MSNANRVDGTGIVIQSLADIITGIINGTIVNGVSVPGLTTIYGADINTDPNSPDGNWINLLALAKSDVLQLAVGIYDNFDPDQAVGTALDALCAFCGIARNVGTYTEVYCSVTATQAASLIGLDQPTLQPFTVQDANGNQFYLISSYSFSVAGTQSLLFRAAEIGAVQISANTITTPVTVIAGISTINNPLGAYLQGVDEETDAALRVRRQASMAIPGKGWYESLYASLLNVSGVTSVQLLENYTGSTDANGVPANSIWAITKGGAAADIAAVIYAYRPAGVGMKGGQSVVVTQADSSTITIKFDYAVTEAFYAQMKVEVLGGGAYDPVATKAAICAQYLLGVGVPADVSSLIAIIKAINPTLVISNVYLTPYGVSGFSGASGLSGVSGITTDIIYPTAKNYQFIINPWDISFL